MRTSIKHFFYIRLTVAILRRLETGTSLMLIVTVARSAPVCASAYAYVFDEKVIVLNNFGKCLTFQIICGADFICVCVCVCIFNPKFEGPKFFEFAHLQYQ